MKPKKATYKQLIGYLDQLHQRIENNQKLFYELAQMFTDYVEMTGKSEKLNKFIEQKYQLGSDAGIPTHWSVFYKSLKNKYLKLKKKLAFKKKT
jgi:hypothetical protein|tara:strand:- start:440 stop:721 length:282 start_codon:yes stop_codon:yes gene_type:complete